MSTMKGFTLLETLIAITILTLAVSGPLLAASRAVVAAQIASQQLTASYLAQEGIEYIRALRDNQYLVDYQSNAQTATTQSWTEFLNTISVCTGSGSCYLDDSKTGALTPITPALFPCSGTCRKLYLGKYAGTFTVNYYTVNTIDSNGNPTIATPFTRTIRITNVQYGSSPISEVHVSSTVTWTFHGTPYTVIVGDNLTEWQ